MDRLPLEMWHHIFHYLETQDLLNFCDAFTEHKYLLNFEPLVKKFSLTKFEFYDINIYHYLKKNVNCNLIRTLNINGMYWVPLGTLRQVVKYLSQLKELLALDTSLALRRRDVVLYRKLEALALTIREIDLVMGNTGNMRTLKKFCVRVVSLPNNLTRFYKMFDRLKKIEELWIEDAQHNIRYGDAICLLKLVEKMKNLQKLVIKIKTADNLTPPTNMIKVFERHK